MSPSSGFLALVVALTSTAFAEWRNLGPGGGGWIPCMAVSPHDSKAVYAGCDVGGFFKSTDSGATWRILNTGLHDLYVEVIAPHPVKPNVIYIGTEGGVHRSDDGGEHWQWLREGFPPTQSSAFSAPIGALAIDPQQPDTVYAGIGRPRWGKGGTGMIYKTTDAGAHWQIANANGGGVQREAIVSDLVVHPSAKGRVFAATDRGLYRSDDAGATWRRMDRGLPHTHTRRVALCMAKPEVMYLTLHSKAGEQPWQGGVYRSDDGGETWSARLEGLGKQVGKPGSAGPLTSNVDRIVVHPTNPGIAYAGDTAWVSAFIYRTTDGGQHWERVLFSKETKQHAANMAYGWITAWGPNVMGLALDAREPDTVWFSTSGHVFRSTDRGQQWRQTYARRVDTPKGAPQSDLGWWSTTGLETTCGHQVVVHPCDPQRLFFAYADIGLLQSFDGGRSFTPTVREMKHTGNTFTLVIDPDAPDTIFAGTGWWNRNEGDVCRSTDGGLTWSVVGREETGLPIGQTHHLVLDRSSKAGARRVFATVKDKGVFVSEDNGSTWQPRNDGLPHLDVKALAQHTGDAATLFVALTDGMGEPGGIYRSTDRGLHWQRVGGDFACADPTMLITCPSDPKRLYLSSRTKFTSDRKLHNGGVFVSHDEGGSWQRILDDRFANALAVDPKDADLLYAGGMDHPYHDEALGSGVQRSRDGGKTWQSLNTPALTCTKIASITVNPHHTQRLYVSTSGNGMFVWEE